MHPAVGAHEVPVRAAVPRTCGLIGAIDWTGPAARDRTLRILACRFPAAGGAFFLFLQSPVLMVQIRGVGGSVRVAVLGVHSILEGFAITVGGGA
ncbi:hypothetical protein [Streptomonospora arabica]|uniref:Uncharacterized protein n=1 Tax=Streptomonospora arabica TaxID=412417 RepID=A0ABV9SIZ7_9ACTN